MTQIGDDSDTNERGDARSFQYDASVPEPGKPIGATGGSFPVRFTTNLTSN